jgi:hypothetical protein
MTSGGSGKRSLPEIGLRASRDCQAFAVERDERIILAEISW